MSALTPEGRPVDSVLADLEAQRAADVDWRSGKVLSGLYDPGGEAGELAKEAYSRFLTENALYVNFYPSINRMEKQVVRAVADLVQGGPMVAGSVTSGGTESIILAVKTARDWAKAKRPGVTAPEMVLPVSAHPAFHKAAQYLGVRAVVTPMDLTTFRADMAALREAISGNTILVVGSAPTYSHGVVDPIPEMAAIAAEAGAFMHVDGCVGAIPLGLMRLLGEPVPAFDFSVPGVTTLSADLHKYGYAPKNASVLLYENAEVRRFAWFVNSSTTEYAVINPTVQSSRTGGPVAAAWALFQHLGLSGYMEMTRKVLETTRAMIEGVAGIDGIGVLGSPEMTMFTLASDTVNVFEVDDEMRRRGWSLLPEFSAGGGPANLHVAVSASNVGREGEFISDLRESVAEVHANPRVDRSALAAAGESVSGGSALEVFAALAPLVGLAGMELPQDMAALNTAMDMLPADLRDELLTDFANLMW